MTSRPTTLRGSRLLRLLLLCALLAWPARAHALEPLSASVVGELQQASFAAARAELRRLPEAQQKARTEDLERLDYAVTLSQLADDAARLGRRSDVERLVGELRALDITGASLAYKEGVLRLNQRLQQRLRESDAPRARELLAVADDLRAKGELTAAGAIYKSLVDAPDAHLPDIVTRARAGGDAVLRGTDRWTSERIKANDALTTLAVWACGLGAAWLLLRVLRWLLAFFPHQKPSIELDEADATERGGATRQLVELLMTRDDVGHGLSIDTIEDLDRSGLSNISLATQDADALKEIASSTERISVAGVSFTPQQLYALLLPLRRPFSAEYTGLLRKTASGYRLSLRIRDNKPGLCFSCQAATRDEALAEGADYIAFRAPPWQLSSDWRSFRAHRKAERLLQTLTNQPNSDAWATARGLLEEAVGADPKNVAALYRLGVMLRRVGKNGDAAGVLTRLDAQLHDPKPPQWLQEFTKRNPDFKHSVRYDLALCFAKQDGFEKLEKAQQLLGEIEAPPRSERGEDAAPPGRFALLASSAVAAVLAGKLGLEGFRVSGAEKQEWYGGRAKELSDEITRRRQDLEVYRRDPRLEHLRECTSALAVALAAEGRALFLRNKLRDAEMTLRNARSENPKLACAAVHLAQVLKASNDSGRIEEAIGLLTRAVELSPRNSKAYYLLGNLHLFKLKEPKAALPYLEKSRECGENAATDLVYAQCLDDLGRDAEACDVLDHSMHAMQEPVNYRYELYLRLLKNSGTLSAEKIAKARWCFARVRESMTGSDLERSVKLMNEMRLA
jgi:tetratricopeptide (TPR) repeat protein